MGLLAGPYPHGRSKMIAQATKNPHDGSADATVMGILLASHYCTLSPAVKACPFFPALNN